MSVELYKRTVLTGGGAGALDLIDGAGLNDGDVAFVMASGIVYVYELDADSGAAEASPGVIQPDTNAGTKRWILQGVQSITIGSDADGDMYYRASSALARLAKGAANLKLFMNAGATAPEWAGGLKIGTLTRDIAAVSGDVAYTGVGFKPSAIAFISFKAGSTAMSIGLDDATNHYGIADLTVGVDGANVWGDIGGYSIFLKTGATPDQQIALVKTMDADGFTLTWTKAGTPTGTGTVYYIAMR